MQTTSSSPLHDSTLLGLVQAELERQKSQLQMIPSENYVSADVLRAVGSVLMNKYSEGQVDKRYYQGNQIIDQIESLVKERALAAFQLDEKEWGVNVQAVTGSVANLAVYSALLQPGEKLMGMFLYDGGHLSHGWRLPYDERKPVSFTARIFETDYYYVDPGQRVFDYDQVQQQILAFQPKIIISGGTAYPREIDHARMRQIADLIGAYYMADIAHEAGLVLAGHNASPFPHAHVVTMTSRKTLRGPVGALIFARHDLIDQINSAVFPGLQGGPQNHSIAGIGVALYEAMQPEFKEYAHQVIKNAQALADEMMQRGFDVVAGGTDKHLVLVDLRSKGLSGHDVALKLEEANIIVNKNTVPNETAKPWRPSGIRLGSPALTSRGMKEEEMRLIVDWIDRVVQQTGPEGESSLTDIARQVEEFARQFPIPGDLNS